MAISTGSQLKMVQVSTQAKYNDISPKDPATLYWVVESRKIYLDGTSYGFNYMDISGEHIRDLIEADNAGNSVQLSMYYDEENTQRVMFEGNVKLTDDVMNLLKKEPDGSLLVFEDDITQLVDDKIYALVLDKRGQTNGFATLDAAGKVPAAQLPSFVDDVLEFSTKSAFPAIGEAGKIYVALDTNITYRWGGSAYVEISSSLALGTTSSTAFRGDYGNTAYQHVSKTDNPHGVTKAQVGLGSVQNYGLASQAQSEAGTVDTAYMTPLRTKQAINKLAPKVTWTVIS